MISMNILEDPEKIMLLILVLFASASTTVGIIAYRINPRWEMLAIIIYSFLSLITSLLVVFDPFNLHHLPVNLFTFFEYYLFTFLITKTVSFTYIKIPLIVVTSIFTGLAILHVVTITSYIIAVDLIILENILLTILSFYYYKKLIFMDEIIDFKRDFMFWIITGAALYFCSTIPYYLLSAILTFKNMKLLFFLNAIMNAIMHSFFMIGFLRQMRGRKAQFT
jgi:hypothetical protein